MIWDWCQILGDLKVERVWLHMLSKRSWKLSSFHIMAGILSGPKALDDLRLLVADLSSAREKGELSIGRVPDTGTLGSVQVSGTLALLPRRFSKWLDQFSKRFLAEPPFILTEEPEFLPERSFMVFQARWCFRPLVFFREFADFAINEVYFGIEICIIQFLFCANKLDFQYFGWWSMIG